MRIICLLALSGIALSAQVAAPRTYSLSPVTHGVQLKTPDGRVVFEYMKTKPDPSDLTSTSAACFHPVLTPSGERVSNLAPDDHPHHRGMYLAWHNSEFRQPIDSSKGGPYAPLFGWNITRADFWGWGVFAPVERRVIQTADVKLLAGTADRADIEVRNDWIVGTRKMLDETTTARVTERDGVYLIDLVFRLAPLVDYHLAKQSFSGFNFQARKDGETHYTSPQGAVTLRNAHYSMPELNWPASPWYGINIKLQNGKTVGAVVMDHPSNPPSTWHGSRSLWMLNPVIAAIEPITIRSDAPLTLRYRVVVHDGETPTPLVENLSTEWRLTR
ncbi:MAG: hypothetical protein EHM55_13360 [Acidobacteria bacterium]|nr:MAG: hypothetical protein EHM55_13360 [Acidobacteriota bacterium]